MAGAPSHQYLIEEFDPPTASEDDFRARYEAVIALDQELQPENPITPFEQHRAEVLAQPSYRRPKYWVAWDGERRHVIGEAMLELEYVDTNRHLAWFSLGVRPEARRQHVATDLLARVAEAGRVDGRTILGGGSIEGHAGDAFAEALGFEKKSTERKSRLTMADVDLDLMRRWVDDATVKATGYDLVCTDDRLPDELLEPFLDLHRVTNTAPRDNLEMEDWNHTPERWRESEEKALARGERCWRVIARHIASGELVGFTDLFFAPWSETVAWQGWTAVRPEHRGHGIGRWVKAVNCLRLASERPEVQAVDTWNAFSNGPMLAINIDMGFELIRGYNDWQAPTDRIASATKERLGR